MTYEERKEKLESLSEFLNGELQDDILLVLDKKYSENKWNILCAAMHWFRVVEPHLDSNKLLKEDLDDYNWGEVYLFISAVDIVAEGINDIGRFLYNKPYRSIFYGIHDIFKNNQCDDWEVFKNIRSVFGAHPTRLSDKKELKEYIVATYPTPGNPLSNRLNGKSKGWDYYTLLWDKNKGEEWGQIEFGFKFEDINKFLDKCLEYLEDMYRKIETMIFEYKNELEKIDIEKSDNPIKQLEILKNEDEIRFNRRYNYIIDDLKVLIEINISDEENNNIYEKYRNIMINHINDIYNAIQFPNKFSDLEIVDNDLNCKTKSFSNMSSYYYQKLYEYKNNYDMENILLEHFKNNIKPFNNNIKNIEELYCLVKAYNFFENKGEKC